MKRKIFSWILGFFGLLGFAMILASAIVSWLVNSFFSEAKVMTISGFLLLVVVLIIGLLFREKESMPWDENWQKIVKGKRGVHR
jgi:high-affinity Fe2+/Pb2+ permease